MTTLDDLLIEIGRLYMENVMLRRGLADAHNEAASSNEGQKENDEQVSENPS